MSSKAQSSKAQRTQAGPRPAVNDGAQPSALKPVALPDKKLLRIGEVADLLGVEPHVVRFWLQQFRAVRPERSDSGRLLFGRPAVERLVRIRELLYGQGYTIAGAKKALAEPTAPVAEAVAPQSAKREAELSRDVERLEQELRAVQARLKAVDAAEATLRAELAAVRARFASEWADLAGNLGDLAADIRG